MNSPKPHIISWITLHHFFLNSLSKSKELSSITMSCRPGDWMCAACHHLNFQKRDSCHRCCCPKYASEADVYAHSAPKTPEMLPGDWYCGMPNCSAHNYASRPICYRCGVSKECCGYGAGVMASAGYPDVAIPGWKAGDWICNRMGCKMHNYACRTECYKCKTPKDFGRAM
ncbi:uncharacterized protein LOC127264944 [Andrographis paniculata]|uniref:uncharacterized protein LOC127264944 n=1 Tax=Andrographis paniculata TaxID=175694 RepID=UPI0021E95028|nr:uncharacterized protein LOC127264944 [Andrographis paniculata]